MKFHRHFDEIQWCKGYCEGFDVDVKRRDEKLLDDDSFSFGNQEHPWYKTTVDSYDKEFEGLESSVQKERGVLREVRRVRLVFGSFRSRGGTPKVGFEGRFRRPLLVCFPKYRGVFTRYLMMP